MPDPGVLTARENHCPGPFKKVESHISPNHLVFSHPLEPVVSIVSAVITQCFRHLLLGTRCRSSFHQFLALCPLAIEREKLVERGEL